MIQYRMPAAIAAFLILLCAYVIDSMLTEQRKDAVMEERRLILMTADEIDHLRLVNLSLTHPGTPQEMVFTHRDGYWFMETPFPGPASQNAMRAVLSNLSGAVRRHAFALDDSVNLEDYGLIEPEIIAEIHGFAGGEAQRQEIHIGRASTMGRIYATMAGSDEVFTVTDHLRNQLRRSANELRSWRLLVPETDQWTQVTIENAHGRLTLEKRDDELVNGHSAEAQTQWHVTTPVAFVADQDFAERFMAALGRADILGYLDDLTTDVLKRMEERPYLTLELEARYEGRTGRDDTSGVWRQRVVIGDEIPEELARLAWSPDTGQKVLVSDSTVDEGLARVQYGDFQQKSLFTFDMDDVSQMEIQVGRSRTIMDRDADLRWMFADDPDSQVDQNKANRLLYELAFVEVFQFVTADPSPETLMEYQLAPPNRQFTITTGRGEGPRRRYGLALGGPHDVGVLYALDQQTSHVVLVRLDGGPNQFMATKGSLMDRRLFPGAIAWPVRELVFHHHDDAYAFYFDTELGWSTRLRSGEIASLNIVQEINDLLLTLSELRIVRKVNPDDPDWDTVQQRPMATRLQLFGPTVEPADAETARDGSSGSASGPETQEALLADFAMEDLDRSLGAVVARIGAGTYLIELRDGDTVLATLENLVRSAAEGP